HTGSMPCDSPMSGQTTSAAVAQMSSNDPTFTILNPPVISLDSLKATRPTGGDGRLKAGRMIRHCWDTKRIEYSPIQVFSRSPNLLNSEDQLTAISQLECYTGYRNPTTITSALKHMSARAFVQKPNGDEVGSASFLEQEKPTENVPLPGRGGSYRAQRKSQCKITRDRCHFLNKNEIAYTRAHVIESDFLSGRLTSLPFHRPGNTPVPSYPFVIGQRGPFFLKEEINGERRG
ncbi:15074_t:CDS:2, partial [Acaulospora colombiana]